MNQIKIIDAQKLLVLQNELDYETQAHHSNLYTTDLLEDLEQATIVEAIFL